MKRFEISEEQASALSESIVIWKGRSEGDDNDGKCPLCEIQGRCCGDCVIYQDSTGCSSTEFFDWNEASCRKDLEDMKKYGTLMYNRLVRLQSESETFTIVDK